MNTDHDTHLRLPVLLSAGFRFYFLAAGCFAILSLGAWLGWLGVHAAGGAFVRPVFAMAPHLWHAHEMVYGYTVAVIAGFFLTAVPSWTGTGPAREFYVLATGLVWLAGRAAIWFSASLDPLLVAAIDLAFIPVLGMKVGANLLRRTQLHNLVFLVLLAMLFAGNALMHLDWIGWGGGDAQAGVRLGLLTSAAMIVIIGGRVVPGFTRNALNRAGYTGPMPVRRAIADRTAIVSAVLLAVVVGLDAPAIVVAGFAFVAAIANCVRLIGWRGQATLHEPILWSLHLSFGLLALGYALLGGAHLFGQPGEIAAIHFIAIGAVGGMTLAMMTRASLGHTGRALAVARPIALAYLLIAAAALVRTFGLEAAPDAYYVVIFISGGLWITGFALFVWVYAPILGGPDIRRANA